MPFICYQKLILFAIIAVGSDSDGKGEFAPKEHKHQLEKSKNEYSVQNMEADKCTGHRSEEDVVEDGKLFEKLLL